MHRVSTAELAMVVALCLLLGGAVAMLCVQVDLVKKIDQQTIKIKDMNDKLKILTLKKE